MPSLTHHPQSVRVRAVSVPQVWKQALITKRQVSVSVSRAQVGFQGRCLGCQSLISNCTFPTCMCASPLPVDEFPDSTS